MIYIATRSLHSLLIYLRGCSRNRCWLATVSSTLCQAAEPVGQLLPKFLWLVKTCLFLLNFPLSKFRQKSSCDDVTVIFDNNNFIGKLSGSVFSCINKRFNAQNYKYQTNYWHWNQHRRGKSQRKITDVWENASEWQDKPEQSDDNRTVHQMLAEIFFALGEMSQNH